MLKEVTVDTLKITFGASKRAAGYQIRYKRSGAGSWKMVRTGKQTVTLKKLKKNTKYKVQVRGINNRENGAWTKTKTFRTLGKEYDVAPSTVKRKSATQDTMTVRFGRAPKATKYQLRYKKADDEKWKTITTQKRTITLDKLEKYTNTDSFSNFSDNKWEKSRAQKWCTNFYRKTGGFSDLEKNAIIGVKTTEDTEDYEYRVGSRKIKLKGCNFDGTSGDKNKVFFLSAREYKIYNKSVTGEKNIPTSREWLLRTPGAEKNGLVATVHGSGRVNLTSTKNRPSKDLP